ncbi:MAG TPA: DUF1330 domain-containing protein [Chitinophagaceae bacterium]
MKGYIIVEIEVHNPKEYEGYKLLSAASLKPYNGRFIVRGGKAETLEGEGNPKRIVVLEFPSVENAKAWWSSQEYAPAKKLRQQHATSRMIVVEGFEETT